MDPYHPHLSKVKKAILSEVSRPFVNIGEVREVDTQVGNTGRVTSEESRVKQYYSILDNGTLF